MRLRAMLLAGLALTGLLCAPQRSWSQAPAPQTDYRALAHAILQQLVEIDSTHAKGSMVAAQAVAARALASGFAPNDVHVLAPDDHPTKANVVIRLRGKGRGKPLLILGHLDVVEAERGDWTTDPFKLVEKDGYYYGRGTEDMKGEDALMLTTLIRLKAEGYIPDRDIIVAFTADEEAGGDANGPQWLFAKHRDLVDAGLALNQDGGGPRVRDGRQLFIAVETSEKLYATYEFETTNRGGHSSLPRPDNAIYTLTDGLQRLAAYRFPLHLTDTTRAFFTGFAALNSGQMKSDMVAVAQAQSDTPESLRLSAADPLYNALLRTTCVATMVRAGVSESALPSRAQATVQCRIIPGESPEQTLETLQTVVANPAIKITVDLPIDPSYETKPSPAVMARYKAAADPIWPNSLIIPVMEPGASDSVYSRLAGIPSYLSGSIPFDEQSRAHGRDERVGVKAFDDGLAYDYRLFKVMSAKD